jgi:hypothetical protein
VPGRVAGGQRRAEVELEGRRRTGEVAGGGTKNSPVAVQWNAEMTLTGGREQATRQFSRDQSLLMSFAPQPTGARGLDVRTS